MGLLSGLALPFALHDNHANGSPPLPAPRPERDARMHQASYANMNGVRKLFVMTAVIFIALGVALAVALIVGIWTGFDNEVVGKSTATLAVLFFTAAALLVVTKEMCEKPKDK